MRWSLSVIGIAAILFAGIGLAGTVPVGLTAQDVQEAMEQAKRAHPELSVQDAVASATKHLQHEQQRRLSFLFAAYMVIWVVLGGYMLGLSRRQAHLQNELERLRSQLRQE